VETRELFAVIRQRPGLYGLDGSFGQHCAFIEGMNTARDGRLLTGFREMLVTRFGDGNNLTWPALIRRMTSGGDDTDRVSALYDLLEEFLDRQTRPEGLALLFDDYLTWLRAQSWYKPPAR
jgi:hypothetical protein